MSTMRFILRTLIFLIALSGCSAKQYNQFIKQETERWRGYHVSTIKEKFGKPWEEFRTPDGNRVIIYHIPLGEGRTPGYYVSTPVASYSGHTFGSLGSGNYSGTIYQNQYVSGRRYRKVCAMMFLFNPEDYVWMVKPELPHTIFAKDYCDYLVEKPQ